MLKLYLEFSGTKIKTLIFNLGIILMNIRKYSFKSIYVSFPNILLMIELDYTFAIIYFYFSLFFGFIMLPYHYKKYDVMSNTLHWCMVFEVITLYFTATNAFVHTDVGAVYKKIIQSFDWWYYSLSILLKINI